MLQEIYKPSAIRVGTFHDKHLDSSPHTEDDICTSPQNDTNLVELTYKGMRNPFFISDYTFLPYTQQSQRRTFQSEFSIEA
jgi:hypothetical protein